MWKFLLLERIFPIIFPLLVEGGLRALGYNNPPLAYALFAIAFGLFVWFIVDWWKHKDRYQAIYLQELIGSIPRILDNLHDKRGLVTKSYVRRANENNDFEALNKMNRELDPFLGGGKQLYDIFTNRLSGVEGGEDILTFFRELFPKSDQKPLQLTDYEIARLVANSAKTHLPIQDMLDRKKWYQGLNKSLKNAMNRLPNTVVVKATEITNYYLTYSEALWVVDAILLSNVYMLGMIEDSGISLPQETITAMKTAYNIYEYRFQKLMDVNKAKVCEIINDYTLQIWSNIQKEKQK